MSKLTIRRGGSRLSLPAIDPTQFNDLIALKTEWNATKSIRSGVQNCKLTKTNTSQMKFEATASYKILWALFIAVGIVIFFIGLFSLILPMILCGVGVAALGAYVLYQAQPIVFDKSKGTFTKGNKNTQPEKLENVHGLQLLTTVISGKQKSNYCYELNFVLNDGKRINIISHGNKNGIRKDAHSLGDFLGKPVWDATS